MSVGTLESFDLGALELSAEEFFVVVTASEGDDAEVESVLWLSLALPWFFALRSLRCISNLEKNSLTDMLPGMEIEQQTMLESVTTEKVRGGSLRKWLKLNVFDPGKGSHCATAALRGSSDDCGIYCLDKTTTN